MQEMCSRMGAVTGKGLSDLIREEFGLRITFVVMTLLVLVNLTNVMANFAGIASSLELFHVSPLHFGSHRAVAVWLLIVKGNYQSAEKIFLFACVLYVAYIISGILVKPDWTEAAIYSVKPMLMLDRDYIKMLIGMVGTTIAPWMQFYLQAAVVEKGITAKEYAQSRVEVIVGCIVTDVVAFFIIVACAGAIWTNGPRDIESAADAAKGLQPFGQYAYLLFSAGLAERVGFRGLHSAALHGLLGVRRAGLRIGRGQALQRGPDFLLALYAADRDWRGGGADSRLSAGQNDPVFAGD